MKLSVLLLTLFCWATVPSLSFAEDGHNHAEEGHKEAKKGDDHSDHAHDEAKKKTKKKHEEKGHDHSEEENHDEDDGHEHKDDKSSSNDSGDAHGDGHEHAESEEGHEEEGEEKHAHAEEEGGHDDHGEEGGHDEHGSNSSIGPGKAIVEVAEEGNKFKLSKESEEFLKISTAQIEPWGDNSFRVPKKYIVTYQNSKGLYVKSGDWFEIRGIEVLSSENGYSVVSGKGLSSDSTIAATGLGFLRAAHLQASGQGGKGHAH